LYTFTVPVASRPAPSRLVVPMFSFTGASAVSHSAAPTVARNAT